MIHAFSQKRASQLTGLSVRQLEYWDQTDVIKPSVAPYEIRNLPRMYSFRDLMRLRVGKELRDARMLPSQIRTMIQELERHGYEEPLLTLRFVTAVTETGRRAREVFWLDPRTKQPRSARYPGQVAEVFDLRLVDVQTGIEGRIAELLEREPGKIVKVRGLRGSAPVLDGTRIPTAKVYALSRAGWSSERIAQSLGDLTDVDVGAAIAFEEKRRKAA